LYQEPAIRLKKQEAFMTVQTIDICLTGAGNVGRRVMQILYEKADMLSSKYGFYPRLVGVADSGGAAMAATGLPIPDLVALKKARRSVAELPEAGKPGLSAIDMIQSIQANVLLNAPPANLRTGEPGLSSIRAALAKGWDVVTADKGPLVLAWDELIELSQKSGKRLRFSATVGGGLPAVNIGRRDMAGAEIYLLEGVVNLTANSILVQMDEAGLSYEQALAHAQAAGHAEADPSLDVEGWDAACKLVILARSVLGVPAALSDVGVQGITGVTQADLRQAQASGCVLRFVARAERIELGQYRLKVGPVALPSDHPLARLQADQMGIVYYTDVHGVQFAVVNEPDPGPTAGAVLRDLIDLYGGRG